MGCNLGEVTCAQCWRLLWSVIQSEGCGACTSEILRTISLTLNYSRVAEVGVILCLKEL